MSAHVTRYPRPSPAVFEILVMGTARLGLGMWLGLGMGLWPGNVAGPGNGARPGNVAGPGY